MLHFRRPRLGALAVPDVVFFVEEFDLQKSVFGIAVVRFLGHRFSGFRAPVADDFNQLFHCRKWINSWEHIKEYR